MLITINSGVPKEIGKIFPISFGTPEFIVTWESRVCSNTFIIIMCNLYKCMEVNREALQLDMDYKRLHFLLQVM